MYKQPDSLCLWVLFPVNGIFLSNICKGEKYLEYVAPHKKRLKWFSLISNQYFKEVRLYKLCATSHFIHMFVNRFITGKHKKGFL